MAIIGLAAIAIVFIALLRAALMFIILVAGVPAVGILVCGYFAIWYLYKDNYIIAGVSCAIIVALTAHWWRRKRGATVERVT